MRHKWMAILVVMVTTLTTAQEALKQYDALKSQAAAWATSGLWTGFLNSYDQAPATLRAQSETCFIIQPSSESQPSYQASLAQNAGTQGVKAHRPGQSARAAAQAKPLPVEDDHRDAEVEAIRQALGSVGEVALLADTGEPEETGAQVYEAVRVLPAGPAENDKDAAGHTMRTVSLSSLAPGRAAASPLAADADFEAAQRQTRSAATRAQAQKTRAVKKALRLLQLQLDRAARQELSRAQRENKTEQADELIMALIVADNPDESIAANLPAPAEPVALPAPVTSSISTGGCAGE